MNKVRMNLIQRDQRPGAALADGSKLAQKFLPILLNRGTGILRRETQIQSPPAVNCGESAWPRAETMDEPGNRLKRIGLQDFALSLPGSLERHRNILTTSPPSAIRGLQQMAHVSVQVELPGLLPVCRPLSGYNSALRSLLARSDLLQEPDTCVSLL